MIARDWLASEEVEIYCEKKFYVFFPSERQIDFDGDFILFYNFVALWNASARADGIILFRCLFLFCLEHRRRVRMNYLVDSSA